MSISGADEEVNGLYAGWLKPVCCFVPASNTDAAGERMKMTSKWPTHLG